MSIKLNIKGFEKLLEDVQAAGGSIDKACDSAMKKSGSIMQSELKAKMQSSGVDTGLVASMPQFEVKTEGNRYSARVGYKKGAYDPDNLSDGYKALFLNYGTPHRTKHGKVKALGFIERAKKSASPKIKREQKAVFKKILSRLEK